MNIKVVKLTETYTAREACEFTINGDVTSKISLTKLCKMEHSPLRALMYQVKMEDIPTYVSVHLVRHKIGVEHFVMSNRNDRGGKGDNVVTRESPVNHMMIINAEALISMAKKRLCYQASSMTRLVMTKIKQELQLLEPELAGFLVPNCIYRGGMCPEHKPCGMGKDLVKYHADYFKNFTLTKE